MNLSNVNNAFIWRTYLKHLSDYVYNNFSVEDYLSTIDNACNRFRDRGYGRDGVPWPEEINNWRIQIVDESGEPLFLVNFYGQVVRGECLYVDGVPSRTLYSGGFKNRLLSVFKTKTRNFVGLVSINDCPKPHQYNMKYIALKYIHENAFRTWIECESLRPWIKEAEHETSKSLEYKEVR